MTIDAIRDGIRFTEEIRDPVWKSIRLTPTLKTITRTAPFLRLYRIKQLGPTEYIYPGATHSRASHSLGVYHLALRMLKVILDAGGREWLTSLGCWSFLAAALLHDLGHFPFTHSLKELPLREHESLTADAIEGDLLSSLICEAGGDPLICAAIIDQEKDIPLSFEQEVLFFRKLLSGVLDPDKLDYLNRDAYYCGVPYGVQDTDFILSRITCDKTHGFTLDSSSIMSVEGILFSKYLMYRSVYWHKNVRMATAMMKKTLYKALHLGILAPEDLYPLDDEGIYALIASLDFPERDVALSIRRRSFFSIIGEFDFDSASPAMQALENLEQRTRSEQLCADFLSQRLHKSIHAYEVVIDIPERISFESDILVKDEEKTFSSSSTVFSGAVVQRFTSSLRKIRIAVHPSLGSNSLLQNLDKQELAHCLGLGYT